MSRLSARTYHRTQSVKLVCTIADLAGRDAREYGAFLLSYLVIGGTWFAWHKLFTYVSNIDGGLVWLNLLALLGIVLVPWASKTLAATGGAVGVAVYGDVMSFVAGASLLLGIYVRRRRYLEADAPPDTEVRLLVIAGLPMIGFGVSVPLSFAIGAYAALVWLLAYLSIPLVLAIRGAGARRR
jgi:uncharacterized membrane protein